ncbi:MAG: class I SAM-dependent methyltransferase [Phycisphaerales bacterium]
MATSAPESSASDCPQRAAPLLAPHPAIAGSYSRDTDKRGFLTSIFDETAGDYDRMEAWLSLGSGRWYRRQALLRAGLASGMHVADVATGTGLVAGEALSIIGPGGRLVGIDPSVQMMRRARERLGIETVVGTAEALPFADATFDFVSVGYALRHVEDLSSALAEFRRVLRPGGRVCILEITRPGTRIGRGLLRAYLGSVSRLAGTLAGLSPRTPELWRYYWQTIDRCIPPARVLEAIRSAGFISVSRRVACRICSEYVALAPGG